MVEAVVERPDAKRALYDQLAIADGAGCDPGQQHLQSRYLPAGAGRRCRNARSSPIGTRRPICATWSICVPGPQTKPGAVETVRDMVAAMGKVPVVFKQMVQGYVANRLQAAMQLEVYRMLDEGLVTPKDIDDSVLHGLALRMPILGIMAKADFTGLLLMQQGMKNRSYTPPVPQDHSETLDKLIAEGRTGVMAGKGLFRLGRSLAGGIVPGARPEVAGVEAGIAGDRPDGGQMISYDLTGKTALVTGGASGIGFATAQHAGEVRRHGGGEFSGRRSARAGGGGQADVPTGGKAIMAPGSVGEAGAAERMVLKARRRSRAARSAVEQRRHAGHAAPDHAAGTRPDHRRAVVATAGNQSARRVPLCQGGGAGVEGGARGDRQHRLDRRAGARRQQPGVQRHQGGRGQPDAESGACAGAGGAGERDRARRGGQFLDGGMDE